MDSLGTNSECALSVHHRPAACDDDVLDVAHSRHNCVMRQGSSDKDKALMRAIINLLEALQGPSPGPSSVSCAFHHAVAH